MHDVEVYKLVRVQANYIYKMLKLHIIYNKNVRFTAVLEAFSYSLNSDVV